MKRCAREYCQNNSSIHFTDFIMVPQHIQYFYFCTLECKTVWAQSRCMYCKKKESDLFFDIKLKQYYCKNPKFLSLGKLNCLALSQGFNSCCFLCEKPFKINISLLSTLSKNKMKYCYLCQKQLNKIQKYQNKIFKRQELLIKRMHNVKFYKESEIECPCILKILEAVQQVTLETNTNESA